MDPALAGPGHQRSDGVRRETAAAVRLEDRVPELDRVGVAALVHSRRAVEPRVTDHLAVDDDGPHQPLAELRTLVHLASPEAEEPDLVSGPLPRDPGAQVALRVLS